MVFVRIICIVVSFLKPHKALKMGINKEKGLERKIQ